ncbi:MAG: CFI-box-CTERM domain-containing protein [Acutalibacteraceae bacterium]|nr:CFI-box-CTERM domain-containing protein [Acutalibacteraceae bacterium]
MTDECRECGMCANRNVINDKDYYCFIHNKYVDSEDTCENWVDILSVGAGKRAIEIIVEEHKKQEAQKNTTPKEGCYIATAVYGSYNAPEVVTLRSFRDKILYKSKIGRLFIKVYYKVSPPVAYKLKNTTYVNSVVKHILNRFIYYLKKSYKL